MNVIAFYWTLPVPWAGFTTLPKDPAAAAQASRTIRYQRERILRWAKDEGAKVIEEDVFLELAPDRGSAEIVPIIDRLIAKAEAADASLVLVDFSEAMRWRRHGPLWARLEGSGRGLALDPVPVVMDGKTFDPATHFRGWRELDAAHRAQKPDTRAAVQALIADLRSEGQSWRAVAEVLNGHGLRTHTGRVWSAETVRKLGRDGCVET